MEFNWSIFGGVMIGYATARLILIPAAFYWVDRYQAKKRKDKK